MATPPPWGDDSLPLIWGAATRALFPEAELTAFVADFPNFTEDYTAIWRYAPGNPVTAIAYDATTKTLTFTMEDKTTQEFPIGHPGQ